MAKLTSITIDDVILYLSQFKGTREEFIKEANKLLCNFITKDQYEFLEKRCNHLEQKLQIKPDDPVILN